MVQCFNGSVVRRSSGSVVQYWMSIVENHWFNDSMVQWFTYSSHVSEHTTSYLSSNLITKIRNAQHVILYI